MQAIKRRVKVLGTEHPDMLSAITDLEQMCCNRDKPVVGEDSLGLQGLASGTKIDKVFLPVSIRSTMARQQGIIQKSKKWL